MSKIDMTVTVKTDAGVALGSGIVIGNATSGSAAHAAVAAVIAARRANATQNAQDYSDAENAFNS